MNHNEHISRVRLEMRLLFGLVMVAFIFGFYQTSQVTEKQNEVVATAQTAALGNCLRNNVNSAVVKGSFQLPEPEDTPDQTRAKSLIATNLYPILDCRASLAAGEAMQIESGEVPRYVAIVFMGRSPVVKDGKIIGSLPSVLSQSGVR